MANQWFKMYGADYLSDPKMKSLTANERSCWLTLLCYASTSSVEGEVMHLTEKQLLIDSGVDPMSDEWNKTTGVLNRFNQLGMIKTGEVGQIIISHWVQRQERIAMSGYDRIKRHRERAKTKDQVEKIQIEPFAEFWTAYPRKTAKQAVFKKWCQINPDPDLKNKMISVIISQSKSPQWQKDNGQFIPHPATWLNQERWNDELTTSKPKVGGGKFESVKSTKI